MTAVASGESAVAEGVAVGLGVVARVAIGLGLAVGPRVGTTADDAVVSTAGGLAQAPSLIDTTIVETTLIGEAIVREGDPICARQLDLAVRPIRSARDHASSADAVLGLSSSRVESLYRQGGLQG